MKPHYQDDAFFELCDKTLTMTMGSVPVPCLLPKGHDDPQHEFHILATDELIARLENA